MNKDLYPTCPDGSTLMLIGPLDLKMKWNCYVFNYPNKDKPVAVTYPMFVDTYINLDFLFDGYVENKVKETIQARDGVLQRFCGDNKTWVKEYGCIVNERVLAARDIHVKSINDNNIMAATALVVVSISIGYLFGKKF